jgi:ParB-like chromosome segregation protein Spo0J
LAARSLGWETIRVLVRHDLAGDDKATERRLIEANEDRRHLTTFQRALLKYRMWQLTSPGDSRKARGQINDELAATLHKTVRQVSRYIQLFDGPAELLNAVKDGLLLPTHGFSTLKLSSDQMQPILDLLRRRKVDKLEVRAMIKQTVASGTPKKESKPETLLNNLFKTAAELMGHASLKELLTGDQRKNVATLRRLLEKMEGRSSPAA